jgi:hypothetical protein
MSIALHNDVTELRTQVASLQQQIAQLQDVVRNALLARAQEQSRTLHVKQRREPHPTA